MNNIIEITKRHLPHWYSEDSTYFINFKKKEGIFNESEQEIIFKHIKDNDKKFYDLIALTVMINHVHLIIKPCENYNLIRIMKGIKGVTARKINLLKKDSGSIWLDESHDRIIRNEKELQQKINYIANNAIKIHIADNLFNYKFFYLKEE